MKRFIAVLKARNIEFIRDRSALSWTIFMPFFLIIGFAVIFSGDDKTIYKVGLINPNNSNIEFITTKYIQPITFDNIEIALDKLKHHKLDMVLELSEINAYWINSSAPNGYLVERILWGTGGKEFSKQIVEGDEIDYVDWVLPGILSFNIMFGCLFGVGYVIVRYRKSGYLKRLKATPLKSMEFLLAQMASRLLLMMTITLIVLFGSALIVDYTMHGSYLLLFFVFLLGSICMISLGLIVAARITSEELAGGLLNLATWPMMVLSGVWFSLEGTHPLIQQAAQVLPLTHIVDASRAVMTEGAGLADISGNLIVLGIMSIVFLFIGARIFRWD
ncbi:MAG: ABC transporter permease [Gammaproteobacteria bacterium]|nr:ABC transporter permease [Gammaproteobacteria bacterium]